MAACDGLSRPKHSACKNGFLGSPSATPTFSFLVRTSSGGSSAISENAPVPLLDAPQGGEVLFAGIRATNLDSCAVQLTAALRDETTNQVIGLDGRPVNLIASSGGFGVPDDPQGLENWSNVPVCPSAAATRGILGTSYRLEIQLRDHAGRTASNSIHVVPFCGNSLTTGWCMSLCAPPS